MGAYLCNNKKQKKYKPIKTITIMKTNRFFKNNQKSIATFMFAAVMVMGFSSFVIKNYSDNQDLYLAKMIENNPEMSSESLQKMSNVAQAFEQFKSVCENRICMEMRKGALLSELQQLKADRNRNSAMVAGLMTQSPNDLSEIVYMESKINRLNHKISSLKEKERMILEKYGDDFNNLNLR